MRNIKAYPSQGFDINGNRYSGMDLRDYFAAKAMQSMLTALYMEDTKKNPSELLEQMKSTVKNSYWFADKMINEREKL